MSDREMHIYIGELRNLIEILEPIHQHFPLQIEPRNFVHNVIRIATRFWADDTLHIMDTYQEFMQLFAAVNVLRRANPDFQIVYGLVMIGLRTLFYTIAHHQNYPDPPRRQIFIPPAQFRGRDRPNPPPAM
jgi:hypothetical protein